MIETLGQGRARHGPQVNANVRQTRNMYPNHNPRSKVSRLVIVIVLALILVGCDSELPVQDDEYLVYSALLREACVGFRCDLILVMDHTMPPGPLLDAESVARSFPNAKAAAVRQFWSRNAAASLLERRFVLPAEYRLLSDQEFESLREPPEDWPSDWPRYAANWNLARAFPGARGVSSFSRVGFDRSGTQALVYEVGVCGTLCGGTQLVLLEKYDDRWIVQGRETILLF